MDLPSRKCKAEKIAYFVGANALALPVRMLEIGTGSGGIASYFGKALGWEVHGVDVEDVRTVTEGFSFRLVDDVELPFPDKYFDVVVSNHVIEHVGDEEKQARHLTELARVMKPDGEGYLAVPNRWMLVEPHYRLPFLSWLPRWLADLYVRISAKGTHYDCRPLTAKALERRLGAAGFGFSQHHSEALHLTYRLERPDDGFYRHILAKIPDRVFHQVRRLFPTLIYTFKHRSERPTSDGSPTT